MMSLSCILLAAGASRRLGHPKQLVAIDGESLLVHSLRLARETGIEQIFVILGAHANAIAPALASFVEQQPITLLHNPQWQQGIASSIRVGIARAAIDPGSSGAMLMACDQPHLSAEDLRQLCAGFHQHTQSRIVATRYAGTVGIPAIFPRASFPALLALKGDQGARQLLRQAEQPPILIDCEAAAFDVDTPEDERRLAATMQPRQH